MICSAEGSHVGYCESDIFKWPYDIHSCYAQYTISTKNNEEVSVKTPADTGIQINEDNKGWKVLKTSVDIYILQAKRDIKSHEIFFYFEIQEYLGAGLQFLYVSIFCKLFWKNITLNATAYFNTCE